MKKTIAAALILLAGGYAQASNEYSKSLLAVELGGAMFDLQNNSPLYADDSQSYAFTGIKIGAENESYRVFLGARYHMITDFDNVLSYGGSLQYLLRVSPTFNLYAGASAGQMTMDFKEPAERQGAMREISQFYYGVDAGVNFSLSPSIDLEVGMSAWNLNAESYRSENGITYTIDNIISYNLSFIYKFGLE